MEINAVKLKEVKVESGFKRDVPYIMDLTFSKYDFQKGGEQITGYSISELNSFFSVIIYIYKMGLSESSLNTMTKPFSFKSL